MIYHPLKRMKQSTEKRSILQILTCPFPKCRIRRCLYSCVGAVAIPITICDPKTNPLTCISFYRFVPDHILTRLYARLCN